MCVDPLGVTMLGTPYSLICKFKLDPIMKITWKDLEIVQAKKQHVPSLTKTQCLFTIPRWATTHFKLNPCDFDQRTMNTIHWFGENKSQHSTPSASFFLSFFFWGGERLCNPFKLQRDTLTLIQIHIELTWYT